MQPERGREPGRPARSHLPRRPSAQRATPRRGRRARRDHRPGTAGRPVLNRNGSHRGARAAARRSAERRRSGRQHGRRAGPAAGRRRRRGHRVRVGGGGGRGIGAHRRYSPLRPRHGRVDTVRGDAPARDRKTTYSPVSRGENRFPAPGVSQPTRHCTSRAGSCPASPRPRRCRR
ncbi:hypothetical protein SBRY_100194 [Actinacidiphila bryophytorum]|uniref:Uncharacterized protein n=1 Tax=Actinacidiphila bryophytorum TaxID=1436133 RepID=A0A9W4E841_9ACTN|nr:hypothetical protein SBRY_100194 [Actinacidiphila bryophytorum]